MRTTLTLKAPRTFARPKGRWTSDLVEVLPVSPTGARHLAYHVAPQNQFVQVFANRIKHLAI